MTFAKTTYNSLPYKFEAGTPNIADTVALNAALEFVESLGRENIAAHEQSLLQHATGLLEQMPKIQIVGTAPEKASVVSFLVKGIHHFDLGMMLDAKGIAVRTGHHCTQPLMARFGIDGTARASFAVYNTIAEIDVFAAALDRIVRKFA